MLIERALRLAEKHMALFDHADLREAFVITDDFGTAGRVSGGKSISIAELEGASTLWKASACR